MAINGEPWCQCQLWSRRWDHPWGCSCVERPYAYQSPPAFLIDFEAAAKVLQEDDGSRTIDDLARAVVNAALGKDN